MPLDIFCCYSDRIQGDLLQNFIIILAQRLQKSAPILQKYSLVSTSTPISAKTLYQAHLTARCSHTRVYQTWIFFKLGFPDRKLNPNFYDWYILMRQFSQNTINKWINDEIYFDQEDSLINQFIKLYQPKKENCEPLESHGLEVRNCKVENVSEVEYAIDIALKDYNVYKINNLRKLLEEYKAQMTEDENNSKYIRILCKIDPANLDQFSGKISKCIEFNELSLRKKDMKAQKPNPVVQQKVE